MITTIIFMFYNTVSVLHEIIWKVMPSVWVFLSCCYWKTSFHFTFTSFKFKVRWILNTKPRNNENKALMWVENLCYKNFIYFTTSLARHKTLIFHATVSNIFTYHLYNTFRFWDDVQGTKPYGKREWRISTSYFSYSALKAYCIVKY